jgi:hypothetical protein
LVPKPKEEKMFLLNAVAMLSMVFTPGGDQVMDLYISPAPWVLEKTIYKDKNEEPNMLKFSYGTIHGSKENIAKVKKRLEGRFWQTPYTMNELFERAEVTIGVFPSKKIKIEVFSNKETVQAFYLRRYGKVLKSSAFMSKSRLTIYISANDVTATILIHEFAHCILQTNLKSSVSYGLQEVLAQYVEREALI